jgi:hypothetical protein
LSLKVPPCPADKKASQCYSVTQTGYEIRSAKEEVVNTQPVRIPEETYRSARQVAGLLGTTPGGLLQEAFQEYVARHRDEINEAFDYAKKYVASQDREGLVHLASQGIRERARQAAAAARPRPEN